MAKATAGSDMRAMLSCLAYSAASCSMVLVNKAVMVQFDFHHNSIVMVVQGIVALLLMLASRKLGLLQFRSLSLPMIRMWLPVNIFFVLMIYTSFESLKRVHVPSLTIFKNVTNIVIAVGAWILFKETINAFVGASLVLVLLGAVFAGWTDISFDPEGYMWLGCNCLATAAYVLYMRETVKTPLSTWDKAFLNNALTIPLGLIMGALIGDIPQGLAAPELSSPTFLVALVLSGCVGYALNLASLWCVAETSATTYSMVGALNKIPVTLLGALLFNAPINAQSAAFIAFGLLAGMTYAYAKTLDPDAGRNVSKPASSPSLHDAPGAVVKGFAPLPVVELSTGQGSESGTDMASPSVRTLSGPTPSRQRAH